MPDYFKLPRYEAAVKRENEIRKAAFLNLPAMLCGCKVMQMTLWHWIILDGADAPFVNGFDINNPPTCEGVMLFLWLLSPEFYRLNLLGLRTGAFIRWRQRCFIRKHRKILYKDAVIKCLQYVKDTFQDFPGLHDEDKYNKVAYYSVIAGLVNVIAARYAWDDEKILHKPLKVVFQYQKAIDICAQLEAGNSRPLSFNASDAVKREEILEQRAQREKAKLHPGQQVSD